MAQVADFQLCSEGHHHLGGGPPINDMSGDQLRHDGSVRLVAQPPTMYVRADSHPPLILGTQPLAQHELLHLSGGSTWKIVDDSQFLGPLLPGEPRSFELCL